MRRTALALLLVFLAALPAAGADVQVTATVASDHVALSEGVEFQIEVSGASGGVSEPDLPRVEGARIAGPSQQSQISIVNGRMSRSVAFVYQIAPARAGKLHIPSATVRVGGRTYQTRPIDVTVVADGTASPPPRAPADEQAPPAEDIDANRGDTFVQIVVDPPAAFVGQKVLVTFYLVTRATLTNVELQKQPTFAGFWAETLESPNNLGWVDVAVNGVRIHRALLRRYAVFPLTPGDLKLDPFVLRVARRVGGRSGDPFGFDADGPFGMFGRTQVGEVGSPEKVVRVHDLPAAGKPPGFQGAVGRYSVAVQADATTVRNGDALTYRVLVTGDGNVKSLRAPTLALPPEIKQYPPKESEEQVPQGDDYRVKKEFAYILVPELQGRDAATLVVPPATVDYFDPVDGAYKVARSEPLTLTVRPGEPGRAPAAPVLSKEQVVLQGQDVRYVKPDVADLAPEGGHLLRHGWAIVLLALYPLLILGVYAGSRVLERRRADLVGARVRRAGGEARKRLKEAERRMNAGQGTEFFAEVQRAITRYVADKLNANAAGLTRADVEARLAERGADADLARRGGEALDACDLYRFSATEPSADEMRRFYEQAADVLTRLERSKALQ